MLPKNKLLLLWYGEMVVQTFGFQRRRSENVDVAACLLCKTTKFLDQKLSFGSFFVV